MTKRFQCTSCERHAETLETCKCGSKCFVSPPQTPWLTAGDRAWLKSIHVQVDPMPKVTTT